MPEPVPEPAPDPELGAGRTTPCVSDNCGGCDYNASNDCLSDCNGIWGGTTESDDCGVCGGDDSACKRTYVQVQAQSSFRSGISGALLIQAVQMMVTGGKEGVSATVEIVSFVQHAEAALVLDGCTPSMLISGSAELNQVLEGLASTLGVQFSDISADGVFRRQLQTASTIVTLRYSVVAAFDFSTALLHSSFGTSLVSAINAEGSTLPVLNLSDLSTTEPQLSTTVDYVVRASSENSSEVTSLNTSIADPRNLATSINASGGTLAANAVSSITDLMLLTVDCRGLPGGSDSLDVCSVCAGDGASCLDCSGEPHGRGRLDKCSICQVEFEDHCDRDCAGTWGGAQMEDACGDCGGDGSACRALSGTALVGEVSPVTLAAVGAPKTADLSLMQSLPLVIGAAVGAVVVTLLGVGACLCVKRKGKTEDDENDEDDDVESQRLAQQSEDLSKREAILAAREAKTALEAEEHQKRRIEQVARKILGRMRMQAVSYCFDCWAEFLGQKRREEAELQIRVAAEAEMQQRKRMEQAARKILNRMRMQSVARAFTRWLELLQQKRLQETARRVLGRFLWQSTARAFSRWSELVAEKKHRYRVLRKTVARFMHLAQGQYFTIWSEAVRAMLAQKKQQHEKAFAEWFPKFRPSSPGKQRRRLPGSAGGFRPRSPATKPRSPVRPRSPGSQPRRAIWSPPQRSPKPAPQNQTPGSLVSTPPSPQSPGRQRARQLMTQNSPKQVRKFLRLQPSSLLTCCIVNTELVPVDVSHQSCGSDGGRECRFCAGNAVATTVRLHRRWSCSCIAIAGGVTFRHSSSCLSVDAQGARISRWSCGCA